MYNRNFKESINSKDFKKKGISYELFIDYYKHYVFTFFSDMRTLSNCEIMKSLIDHEKKIINDDNYCRPLDSFSHKMKYNESYNFEDDKYEYILKFSDFKNDFYQKFPHLLNSYDKDLNNKIDILIKKITTMEQYQANLIDKINIFAEMIDSIKK